MLTLKLRLASNANWPADLNSQISNLRSVAENCARQVRGWADSLQNSEIKGQRHLNDRVRQEQGQKQRATAFRKQLLANLPASQPLRRAAAEKERDEQARREALATRNHTGN
jgi:hypothetical protein